MNTHDMHAMDKLAACFHESGHAVVGLKRGGTLKGVTRHDTTFTGPHDPVTCYAGGIAVAKFDNGQGKHTADDDGDARNVAALNLDPLDREHARATAAELVEQHWRRIADVAFALDRSVDGRLDPERVAELCR